MFIESNFLSSQNSRVLAQNIGSDSVCYWKPSNGRTINLGDLCESKAYQNQSTTSLPSTKINIDSVSLIGDNDNPIYITGTVRNTGNSKQKYVRVSYQGYNQIDGSLNIIESGDVVGSSLLPGETTFFRDRIYSRPILLLFKVFESLDEDAKPISICYASSVEREELCKRLFPHYIRRFSSSPR